MDITVTPLQLAASPELQSFAVLFTISGGSNKRNATTGDITYVFDATGERLVTPAQFAALVAAGVQIDKAELYVEMTAAEYEENVPDIFPEYTYDEAVDESSTATVVRIWSEYAPFSKQSTDGTKYLVRCAHVKYGLTNGSGLSASELGIWWNYFSGRILTRPEGEALQESAEYKVSE